MQTLIRSTIKDMNEYPQDHYIWNPLAILFFVLLTGGVFYWLSQDRWFVSSLYALNFLDVVIIGLAAFRFIRLFTYDKIMQFFRNWFLNADGTKPEKGIRRAFAELNECIWCTGMWAALLVLVMYFAGTFGVFGVYLLAISALATVFQNISQMITRIGV